MESFYGKIQVRIEGVTPLLMNKLSPGDLETKTRSKMQTYDVDEQAKKSAYITVVEDKEQLYIPSYAVFSMIIQAAKAYRVRRLSLSSQLAGCIRIEPEKILLGHCEYEVDVRPVVIQRARVLRSRAKIPKWEAEFNVIYDKALGNIEILKEVLEDAGRRVGLLDYRPQKKGWFGTFRVKEFKFHNSEK